MVGSSSSPAFYDRSTVSRLTTLSKVTIWRRVRDGQFPAPVRISAGRVAWPAQAVDQWIAEKSALLAVAG